MALGGFIQGISRFAFAMIALSIWAWALAPEVAAELCVLGGLAGMSGSVPAIWTELRGWSRDLRRATMQVYNIAMHIFVLSAYTASGAAHPGALNFFAASLPAPVVSGYFGAKLYHRFSERAFSRLILVLLLLSGFAMLYGSLSALLR